MFVILCGLLFLGAWFSPLHAAPPVPLSYQIQHDYDANIDLLGGGNYLTPDDNLVLDSMTAAEGMDKMQRIECAKENLKSLLAPLGLFRLRAPGEMQRQLLLVLFCLSQADEAGASTEELLDEICQPNTPGDSQGSETLKEVLLYDFHIAQHLGVTDKEGLIRMGQGRPPAVRENDDNPNNRLAYAVPILPPDRFPQVAHQLYNYELFDGPLPKSSSAQLAPSQIEFAQKLIQRGLLPADALKNP